MCGNSAYLSLPLVDACSPQFYKVALLKPNKKEFGKRNKQSKKEEIKQKVSH